MHGTVLFSGKRFSLTSLDCRVSCAGRILSKEEVFHIYVNVSYREDFADFRDKQ